MNVCKQVKNNKELQHIPIILFTATEDGTVADVTIEAGADDYIVKPFEPDKLLEKIKSFID